MVEPPGKRRRNNRENPAETRCVSDSDVIILDVSDDEVLSPTTPALANLTPSTAHATQVPTTVLDDDDEVMIVPVTPGPADPRNAASDTMPGSSADVDGIEIGVLEAAAVYPHARGDCKEKAFSPLNTDIAHAINFKKCDKCYCFVCDIEASKCADWLRHCMASDKRAAWRNMRSKSKTRSAVPLTVPVRLLPPNLRTGLTTAQITPHFTSSDKTLLWGVTSRLSAPFPNIGNGQSAALNNNSHAASASGSANPVNSTCPAVVNSSMHIPSLAETYKFKFTGKKPSKIQGNESRSFVIGKIDLWRPYCSHRKVKFSTKESLHRQDFEDRFVLEAPHTTTLTRVLMKEIFPFIGSLPDGCMLSNAQMADMFPEDELSPALSAIMTSENQEKQPRRNYTCTANKFAVSGYFEKSLTEAIRHGLISVDWELVHHQGSEGSNKEGALASFHRDLQASVLGNEKFVSVIKDTDAWLAQRDAELSGCVEYNASNCCCLRGYVSLLPKAFSSSNVRVAADIASGNCPEHFSESIDTSSNAKMTPHPGAIGVTRQSVELAHSLGKVLTLLDFADFRGAALSRRPTKFFPNGTDNPLMRTAYRGVDALDNNMREAFLAQCSSEGALISDANFPGSTPQELFSLEGILSSPLFTVSTGYAGGPAAQPAGINVQLRGYQRESLKWMEDQEAQDSISDPFWVKVTMAPCVNGVVESRSTSKYFWYCPLTGSIARYPPPKVVGGILAEEMGLGKTILMISLIANSLQAARLQADKRAVPSVPLRVKSTLIMTPVSLLEQWRSELIRRTPEGSLSVCYFYGSNRPKAAIELAAYDVVLTTYTTMASAQSNVLGDVLWYRIVIDESSYIKNGSATRTFKALSQLLSPRRWAVSGTPFANNIKSLVPIMRFLGVSPMACERAFVPMLEAFNLRLSGGHSTKEDFERLPSDPIAALAFTLKSITIRHLKRQKLHGQSLIELPPSTGHLVVVKLTAEERSLYNKVAAEAVQGGEPLMRTDSACNRNLVQLYAGLHPVRRATSGVFPPGSTGRYPPGFSSPEIIHKCGKITRLVRDVHYILSRDLHAKFVVFSDHVALRQQAVVELGGSGVSSFALTGEMSATQRGRILQAFANEPQRKVLILSSKSAHGLTLTCANHVVLLEPSLSQETELQAVDRIRRIGQTRATTVLTYVAARTVDEHVLMLRKHKGQAPAIGLPAPSGGNEILTHRESLRVIYGIGDIDGYPLKYFLNGEGSHS